MTFNLNILHFTFFLDDVPIVWEKSELIRFAFKLSKRLKLFSTYDPGRLDIRLG